MQKFKEDHTFRPVREKTKRLDMVLVKQGGKENKYDRLFKGYVEKAEKLETLRQQELERERSWMSKLTNMKSRSKSQRKQSREMQTLSA